MFQNLLDAHSGLEHALILPRAEVALCAEVESNNETVSVQISTQQQTPMYASDKKGEFRLSNVNTPTTTRFMS